MRKPKEFVSVDSDYSRGGSPDENQGNGGDDARQSRPSREQNLRSKGQRVKWSNETEGAMTPVSSKDLANKAEGQQAQTRAQLHVFTCAHVRTRTHSYTPVGTKTGLDVSIEANFESLPLTRHIGEKPTIPPKFPPENGDVDERRIGFTKFEAHEVEEEEEDGVSSTWKLSGYRLMARMT